MAIHPYRMLLYGASDLDQRCLKTRNSEDECTFPPNVFVPTLKITPKPHFGDLSIQNLLYTELSVSRTLMELRSYRYRQVYLREWGVKIFPLGGVRGPILLLHIYNAHNVLFSSHSITDVNLYTMQSCKQIFVVFRRDIGNVTIK